MTVASLPAVETFPALEELSCVRAAFVPRIPGIEIDGERDEVLARLRPAHDARLDALGFPPRSYAEQVHGAKVAIVDAPTSRPAPGADALATNSAHVTLGIYVADCAAIFLLDPVHRAIALAHSGRKGTEANILAASVRALNEHYGSTAGDLVVVVSPCIRPPHYEIDFASTIAAQARECGIRRFHDAGICTASQPDRYYSYRREKGRTGRMLAALALRG
jgi:Uncharacterized conserved protein